MVKVLASIGMLLTYTAAISAANTPRWADNGSPDKSGGKFFNSL